MVLGSFTGLRNHTVDDPAAGTRAPSEASTRAYENIPCAIARSNPNARADSAWRWIGFTSPDTDAYRRPASSANRSRTTARDARPSTSGGPSDAADSSP